MSNRGTLIERKTAAFARATAVLTKAQTENRGLTAAENQEYQAALVGVQLAGLQEQQDGLSPVGPGLGLGRLAGAQHTARLMAVARAITALLNNQPVPSDVVSKNGMIHVPDSLSIRADIEESTYSTDLPVPAIERTEAIVALPSLRRAGATFLGDVIPFGDPVLSRGVAFVTPGSAATTYSEESGPSSSNDPTIYTTRVTPLYWSDLQKVTIQFYQDLPNISQAGLIQALIKNLEYSIDAAFVATLLADAPAVPEYSDLYAAALEGQASPHSYFMDGSACWLGGRQARRAFLDTRDNFNRPVFTPATTQDNVETLLGYPWILSEAAGSYAIFGNFRAGVTAMGTGTWLQILRELYATSNEFGLKVHARSGMKDYASVVPANKPQPLYVVNTALASS